MKDEPMQPLQTAFTDSYEVPCPHGCGAQVVVNVTRIRGGRVTNLTVTLCPSANGSFESELEMPMTKA